MNNRVPFSLFLSFVVITVGSGCAPVQSSVSASAPHLPISVMAKSSPSSSATSQPLCPSARRYPSPNFPRDSVEASWHWPGLLWELGCPGVSPVTLVPRH
jgi:hypothetical protein